MCARQSEQPATWNAGGKKEGRGGGGRGKAVDRFRHASFVGGTSFISTRPEGEREGGTFRLPFSPSLPVAFVLDEKKRRQIADARTAVQQTAAAVLCVSRLSLNGSFSERPTRARREAVERRGRRLVNELTSARSLIRERFRIGGTRKRT